MTRTVITLLGGALVLIASFFLSLKAIDYFGLMPGPVAPLVSLSVNGKDSIVIAAGTPYKFVYASSGAQSCEMRYRSDEDGSSGHYPIPPNTTGTGGGGVIGNYTLICTGANGASASKTIRISRAPQ